MKKRIAAGVLAALSLFTAFFGVWLCGYADEARPRVDDAPELTGSPTHTLNRFFACLEAKDWAGADECLYGGARLGLDKPPEDEMAARFWLAQQEAWSFSVEPGYEMEGTRLTKRAAVSSLDFSPAGAAIAGQVQALLKDKVEKARLSSEVYDENGAYRESVAMEALEQAVGNVLKDASPYAVTREIGVGLRYADGAWRIEPDGALLGALTGGAALSSESAAAAFTMYINNLTAAAMEDVLPIPKVYWLPEDLVVAPRPDPARFGESADPADTAEVLARAQPLLDGQETIWKPDTELRRNSTVKWYLDETIFSITWKQVIDRAIYTFTEVKLAHPSQFRRYLADNTFAAPVQYLPTELAKTVHAVSAMSGDFYKFRQHGIVVYQRQLYRSAGGVLDTCFVDSAGNLNFVRGGELADEEAIRRYIDEHDILFSLAFGPVMIENGENVMPASYLVGEINDEYARSVLCQLGNCHYLLVTTNHERDYGNWLLPASTVANTLVRMGVPKAYTLDGGQTASMIVNGELINSVEFGYQRAVSDIIYFATAIPEAESGEGENG